MLRKNNKYHSKKYFVVLISIVLFNISVFSQSNNNYDTCKTLFKKNVLVIKKAEFYKGSLGGIWEVWRFKNPHLYVEWSSVDLPHTYNNYDVVDEEPGYYQGVAWYRMKVRIDNYKNKRYILNIEGGGPKMNIYIFNKKVGTTISSYQESTFDITAYVNWVKESPSLNRMFDGLVPIAIKCDNSRDLNNIPSNTNDFPIYGGLFRKITISVKGKKYIDKINFDYDFSKNKKSLQFSIRGIINSLFKDSINNLLYIKVFDNNNCNIVYTDSFYVKRNILYTSNKIKNVSLWSPDTPHLYTLLLTLKENGNEIDNYAINVGFRYFEFIKHGAFYLNGLRLLLKGVCLHEDFSGVGAAVRDSIHEKEIIQIKKMGANFIRLAHYQQSSTIIDLCDKYGLIVWEEIPWSRGGVGGVGHQLLIKSSLENMIIQHYNHPSIIIWGLGNEVDAYDDFSGSNREGVISMLTKLQNIADSLDKNRKTVVRRVPYCSHITDIYSPSLWAGWYSGSYKDYENMLTKHYFEVDHFIHAEWGAGSIKNRHSVNPYLLRDEILRNGDGEEKTNSQLFYGGEVRYSKDGDWSETYACDLVDWHLSVMEKLSWFTGALYWSYKDFATPLRKNNPIPYMNLKGIVQRDMNPKEIYYVFQSHWAKTPMLHIYGHEWKIRWNDDTTTIIPIKVYSNCDKVQMIINDSLLQTKYKDVTEFPAQGFVWYIKSETGVYNIKAIGTNGEDEIVVDTISFRVIKRNWIEPSRFIILENKISNDTLLVKIALIDENGNICLDSREIVNFFVTGGGELVKNMGTVYGSQQIELTNGVAYAKILIKNKNDSIFLSVNNRLVGTTFFSINYESK